MSSISIRNNVLQTIELKIDPSEFIKDNLIHFRTLSVGSNGYPHTTDWAAYRMVSPWTILVTAKGIGSEEQISASEISLQEAVQVLLESRSQSMQSMISALGVKGYKIMKVTK